MSSERCPLCRHADLEPIPLGTRARRGLDENLGKEYKRCMNADCQVYLIRPARTALD
jgi:hypothetical protein